MLVQSVLHNEIIIEENNKIKKLMCTQLYPCTRTYVIYLIQLPNWYPLNWVYIFLLFDHYLLVIKRIPILHFILE